MSRKRKADAVPEERIAEGSGPHADDLAAAVLALVDREDEIELADSDPSADRDATGDEESGESEPRRDERADWGAELTSEQDSGTETVSVSVPDADPGSVAVAVAVADPDVDADAAAALPSSAAAMDSDSLRRLVEALIFASDKPVTLQRLRQLTRISDVTRLDQALTELFSDYRDRGISLHQVSGGYQFRTNTQYSPWVQQLIAGRPVRLSRAQLETLAIIAYRQPITRPEIDDIRGVDSSGTLKVLLERSLIRVLGKKEEVGRPLLYGTTKDFLDFFSLSDLRVLPTLREYSELTAESRKVMSDRLGIEPDGGGGDEVDPVLASHDAEPAPEPDEAVEAPDPLVDAE